MHGHQFEAIYRTYCDRLYHYAYSLCHDDAQSKDLVSDTFLKAFQYLPEEHMNMEAWLYQVLYHLFLDQKRKQNRHPLLSLESFPFLKAKEEPKQEFQKRSRTELLLEQIFSLKETYQMVLYLYYFHQYSIQEISEQLHLSISNVKIRLRRGRALLKQEMEEHKDEL